MAAKGASLLSDGPAAQAGTLDQYWGADRDSFLASFRLEQVRIMNLVCQGAGGLGGQDWDGPHREVGRLVLGHTAHGAVWWVGPTGHYQDSINDASAG